MISFKRRACIIILTLLFSPLLLCSCGSTKASWVNTDSMPGNTFREYRVDLSDKQKITEAVHNASRNNKNDNRDHFGPSFEFNDLRR